MRITSLNFKNNEDIPIKFTCQGQDINPSLIFEDIPKEAKTLVLIMDDPDAPNQTFVHWIMYNIPITNKIEENSSKGKEGINSSGKIGYIGPCPPSGIHRYFFKLYALDTTLALKKAPDKSIIEKAMQDHIIEKTQIIGRYKKN